MEQRVSAERFKTVIAQKCDELREFLFRKNASYGNSVFEPIRIFSRVTTREQIMVRVDDKLSRLQRGNFTVDSYDETLIDLIGYLIILLAFDALAFGQAEASEEPEQVPDSSPCPGGCDAESSEEIEGEEMEGPLESADDLADDLVKISGALASRQLDSQHAPTTHLGLEAWVQVKNALGALSFEQRRAEAREKELRAEIAELRDESKLGAAVGALREIVKECRRRLGSKSGWDLISRKLMPNSAEATWHPILRGILNLAERGIRDDPFLRKSFGEVMLDDAEGIGLDVCGQVSGVTRQHGEEDGAYRERLRAAFHPRSIRLVEGHLVSFGEAVKQAWERQVRSLMRHREAYLKAWAARYGVEDPGDVVLVEQDMGGGRIEVRLERKSACSPARSAIVDSSKVKGQVLDVIGLITGNPRQEGELVRGIDDPQYQSRLLLCLGNSCSRQVEEILTDIEVRLGLRPYLEENK